MSRKLSVIALLLVIVLGSGCIKKELQNLTNPTQGTLTATVNGASFSAATLVGNSLSGYFFITGTTGDGKEISISIPDVSATNGTYTIDSTYHQAWYYVNVNATPTTARTGTITVNLQGNSSASGTFSFTCKDGTTVSNGAYKINFL